MSSTIKQKSETEMTGATPLNSVRKKKIALAFVIATSLCALTAVVAFAIAHHIDQVDKLHRLHAVNRRPLVNAKGGGQIEISIASADQQAARAGIPLDLTATIGATSDLQNLQFEWILPKDMSVLSGETTGSLGDLANGSEVGLKLKVLPATDENALIHLHIFRIVAGEHMGQSAQYNTSLETTIVDQPQDKSEVLGQRDPASAESLKLVQ